MTFTKPNNMRLQKALAQAGIASRRKAIEIIEAGKVEVNGQIVTEKGFSVDIAKDEILVSGKPIKSTRNVYIILNKPKNCISAVTDPRFRKTVVDIARQQGVDARIYPVGRLDKNTTGLLLLTNDGELAFRLMHPKFGVTKTYEAAVKGVVTHVELEKLRRGLFVDGRKTSPAKAELIFKDKVSSKVRLHIHEGRKHQVRLMLLTVGHPVTSLKRVRFGNLNLGTLKLGQSRLLSNSEIAGLKELVEL